MNQHHLVADCTKWEAVAQLHDTEESANTWLDGQPKWLRKRLSNAYAPWLAMDVHTQLYDIWLQICRSGQHANAPIYSVLKRRKDGSAEEIYTLHNKKQLAYKEAANPFSSFNTQKRKPSFEDVNNGENVAPNTLGGRRKTKRKRKKGKPTKRRKRKRTKRKTAKR
jgi:hypothetical protein